MNERKQRAKFADQREDALPPHSPEAEAGVLGCILLGQSLPCQGGETAGGLTQVLERLNGEFAAFYDLQYREVLEAVAELHGEGKPADVVLIRDRIGTRGKMPGLTGGDLLVFLSGLQDAVPSAANVSFYLDIVWEKYLARLAMQSSGQVIEEVARAGGMTEALLARVARLNEDWVKKSERGTITPRYLRRPGEFADEILAHLLGMAGAELPGLDLPIPFPLKIRRKETTLVTGDDGAGKTTVLLYFLLHLAQAGEKIAIASMEMPKDVTLWMLAAMLLGVKRLDDVEKSRARAVAAVAWLNERVVIYDFLGITDWRELLDTYRYAARNLGCTQLQVDSVMRIGIADDDYAQQAFCAAAFANFSMQENGHLWHVIHENKGERGGKAKIRGSKLWSANACNVVRIERNMKKGEELGKHEWELFSERRQKEPDQALIAKKEEAIKAARQQWDTHLVLQKQRWPGSQQNGSKRFWYEKECFQFRDHWEDPPVDWLKRWKADKKTSGNE